MSRDETLRNRFRLRGAFGVGLILAVLAVASVALAACGGDGDGTEANGTGATTTSEGGEGEEVTLTIWDYLGYSPESNAAMEKLYSGFEAENPNVTFKRTEVGYPEMRTKLTQAIATGTMPDIAIIDNVDMPVFAAEEDVLADLTEKFEEWPDTDQYFPNILEKYNGSYWYMPIRANTLALFYNKDIYKEAGITSPPETWEELREMAKELTKGDRYGFCYAAAAEGEGDFQMWPWIWQAGSDLDTLGDEGSEKALAFLNTLMNEDQTAPKEALNWNQRDLGERFNAEKCAMMVNGPWQIQPTDEAGVNYEVVPLFHDVEEATVLGGEHLIVSADAPLDPAWDFLTYTQRQDVLTPDVIHGIGALPEREDQAKEEKWYAQIPVNKQFTEALRVARPRRFGAKYAQIQPILWTMEQQVLTGQKSPQEALDEAVPKIEPLLEEQDE